MLLRRSGVESIAPVYPEKRDESEYAFFLKSLAPAEAGKYLPPGLRLLPEPHKTYADALDTISGSSDFYMGVSGYPELRLSAVERRRKAAETYQMIGSEVLISSGINGSDGQALAMLMDRPDFRRLPLSGDNSVAPGDEAWAVVGADERTTLFRLLAGRF